MEMTANQAMVIPILAVCLIARAASALFCKKPVYHAFSEQLEAEYEAKRKAARAESSSDDPPTAIAPHPATAAIDRS